MCVVTGCLEPSPTAHFVIGETLESFEEFVELWRRDTRTIAAARKREVDRPTNASH